MNILNYNPEIKFQKIKIGYSLGCNNLNYRGKKPKDHIKGVTGYESRNLT